MRITEQTSLWDNLKTISESKPVIIYGMGNGADKILNLCAEKNIKISGVFASDEFVRGHFFRGFKVKKLSEIETEHKDFCVLVAFATREDKVIARICELDAKYELYAPNFPVFGDRDEYFDCDFFFENIDSIEKAYDLLADEVSREVYANAVNFMISGKLKYLKNISTPKSDALDLLDLRDNLCYIDAGAYDGDTILELREYCGKRSIVIEKIIALEPDKKNFVKLERRVGSDASTTLCELYNMGAWSEETTLYFDAKSGRNSSIIEPTQEFVNNTSNQTIPANSIDNILAENLRARQDANLLIKYDVEGSEFEALTGTAETIKKYTPKLIVSLYHRIGDIFKLPLLINNINPNYNFYIRKHKYIPCWDLNLYAVPKG